MSPRTPIVLDGFVRRCVDVVVAALTLAVLCPMMGLLAVLVRLSSHGHAIYRQQRVGRGGRPFWIYKFRTMHAAGDGPSITHSGDGRITALGRRLRQWKLDELPQFFNVLRGDMSLVGPRPEVPAYVRLYTNEQRDVLAVRPGMTGISQLAFRDEEHLLSTAADVEALYISSVMPAKLKLDLDYVRSRTLGRDLRLLVDTVVQIARSTSDEQRGAELTRASNGHH